MTNPVRTGEEAPKFTATLHDGRTISLHDYRGRSTVVLFFYPKDNTAVCTKEACGFRDDYEQFTAAGATVIGISSDDAASHQRFADTHRLPFALVVDENNQLRRLFGVPKTLGILPGRVTYVIDRAGNVRLVFNSPLQVGRHVEEALTVVRRLEKEKL